MGLQKDLLLRDGIHAHGGPLIHNRSEEEQCSFDSTCRQFHRFLTQPQHCARQFPTDSPDELFSNGPPGAGLGYLDFWLDRLRCALTGENFLLAPSVRITADL